MDQNILSNLWYFRAAAENESFAKAAKELNITQGAVSQRVKNLQNRLGFNLFERVGRSVQLSPEGKKLLALTSNALDALDHGIGKIQSQNSRDTLVVSTIPSFAMDWLMPRMQSWYEFSDGLPLQVRADLEVMTPQLMVSNGIDLAIQCDPFEYDDLYVQELAPELLCPVASPDFVKDLDLENLEEVLKDTVLIHDKIPWKGASATIEWSTWLDELGLDTEASETGIFHNLGYFAQRSAEMGHGLAMGRRLLVADQVAAGSLVFLSDRFVRSPATYKFVSRHKVSDSPHMLMFTKWIRKEIEQQVSFVKL